MEPFDIRGTHRSASLRCGHVFGEKCVSDWLKSKNKICPLCREPASIKDIRTVYSNDNEEIERLKAELKRKSEELEALQKVTRVNSPRSESSDVESSPKPPKVYEEARKKVKMLEIVEEFEEQPHRRSPAQFIDLDPIEDDWPHPVEEKKPSEIVVISADEKEKPKRGKAPAILAKVKKKLDISDGAFVDVFPALDILIATSSLSVVVTSTKKMEVIHPRLHGKETGSTANFTYGIVLYPQWASKNAQTSAYYVSLSVNPATCLKLFTDEKKRNFFLLAHSGGAFVVGTVSLVQNRPIVNLVVDAVLDGGNHSLSSVEFDNFDKNWVYASIRTQIVRMNLNNIKTTSSVIDIPLQESKSEQTIFEIISLPPLPADADGPAIQHHLIVGASNGIFRVLWSRDQKVRSVERIILNETVSGPWYALQRHPANENTFIAVKKTEMEQHCFTFEVSQERKGPFTQNILFSRHSPSNAIPRAVNGLNDLAPTMCTFMAAGQAYILLSDPAEAFNFENLKSGHRTPNDALPPTSSYQLPIILPFHLPQVSIARYWKTISNGEKFVVAGISFNHIIFLMPY